MKRTSRGSHAPVRRLTIYQLRQDFNLDDVAKTSPKKSDVQRSVCTVGGLPAFLIARQMGERDVSWWKDIKAMTGTKRPPLRSQSAGAALFITYKTRKFAIVYGDGRYLLPANSILDRFGLRVALNAVNPNKLRALDHARIDAFARSTREQMTIPGPTRVFGIDVAQDLLSAAAGAPSTEYGILGSWLVGKDALTLPSIKFEPKSLSTVLDHIIYLADAFLYKMHFPWVDNVRAVEDPATITKANELLVSKLSTGKYEATEIALGLPDIVDWEGIAGFRYSSSSAEQTHAQLDLNDFIAHLTATSRTELTIEKLRRRRIFLVDTDDALRGISAWKCLVAELEDGAARYTLHAGTWYQIDSEFVAEVDNEYQRIPLATHVNLPDFDDSDEAEYVRRVAAQDPARFTVLDGAENLISYGGGKSKIEFCDLLERLDAGHRMIHLKRYTGSATLSHLFAQGVVSAETYLSDPKFRRIATENASGSQNSAVPDIDPQRCEVVFGIIQRSGTSRPHMPFFSRLNLRAAVRRLQGYGFTVSLLAINDVTPVPEKTPRKQRAKVPSPTMRARRTRGTRSKRTSSR